MIALFTDAVANRIAHQALAESYNRIYPYASEDFANHQDLEVYIKGVSAWITSVEERLSELGSALSTHTHTVPPHIHNIPAHTHNTVPHFHVGNIGYPTSPDVVVVLPATPGSTSPSSEFPTEVPVEPSSLTWRTGSIPKEYINTSGSVTNMNNKVVIGSGVIGSSIPIKRRATPVTESTVPIVPPYAAPSLG